MVILENQVFQFFVRATDRGTPAMYTDVSVDVYIMSSKDIPPVFERNDDKLMLSEDTSSGIFYDQYIENNLFKIITNYQRILNE